MARSDPPSALAAPQISLLGEVNEAMVRSLKDQLAEIEPGRDTALEITTLGGDPDYARRIVLEIDRVRQRLGGRFCFLGKTVVYSAGVTIMSAFPRADRYLAPDTVLLIHGRQLEQKVELSGPIRTTLPQLEALCAQLRSGLQLEEDGFRRLIEGSDIDLEELREKALANWYLTAEEAVGRRLVAGLA